MSSFITFQNILRFSFFFFQFLKLSISETGSIMEEEHHHHHSKSHECETTVVAEETSVESKDRGLFDFLGKKKEENKERSRKKKRKERKRRKKWGAKEKNVGER